MSVDRPPDRGRSTSRNGLRVAIILSELRAGGMERVVVHLANGLGNRDIDTLVVCLENPGELAADIITPRVTLTALESRTSMDLRSALRLGSALVRFDPDVINIHDYSAVPYAVAANVIGRRVPVVFTAHGLLYEGFDGLQKRCRFFSRGFSAVSAVSREVAERHRHFLNWKDEISVIGNGVPAITVDAALRRRLRGELGCAEDQILFLAVGNPRPEKGFEDLIDAAAILKHQVHERMRFMVAVAGKMTDSAYCRMLQARVERQGVGDVLKFIGFQKDMKAAYSAADVFVLSSRSEGLPMVVLEAMTAGRPVIATRVGGVPAAVLDKGLLVAPAQPDRLADAMARLVSEQRLAERLARAGKAHAMSTYGVDRMVARYIALFNQTKC